MIQIKKLVWTEKNIEHIARHDVTRDEVEEVCHGVHVAKDAHAGRAMIIGPTKSGRALCIILDPEEVIGVWYPVTARSADRGERRKFTLETGVTL
jgi:uncharacterized DUF497 family protein